MSTTDQISRRGSERPSEHPAESSRSSQMERRQAAEGTLEITDALLDEIEAVLDVKTPEPEVTLSDLMRLGAQLAPQGFGAYHSMKGESCALGAVYDGAKALGLV